MVAIETEVTPPPLTEADLVEAAPRVPNHTATRSRAKFSDSDKDKITTPSVKQAEKKKYVKGQFKRPLTDLYMTIGMMIVPFDQPCGTAVIESAEKCAESLDALAQTNDAVKRAIFMILETSAVGAVIAAHLPIILAVVMHHNPGVGAKVGGLLSGAQEGKAE